MKQIVCPAIVDCDCTSIRQIHETELRGYNTPQQVVWGGPNRKCCNHIWCLPHDRLLLTEQKLTAKWNEALSKYFEDFEKLYSWVGDNILVGIWNSARVLQYDIALRVSYQRYFKGIDDIRPSKVLYLHGKPWRSAKALDPSLTNKEFCKPVSYIKQMFVCPNQCDAVQCEHVLCVKHKQIH